MCSFFRLLLAVENRILIVPLSSLATSQVPIAIQKNRQKSTTKSTAKPAHVELLVLHQFLINDNIVKAISTMAETAAGMLLYRGWCTTL